MDDQMYSSRFDAFSPNTERTRPNVARKKDNPFVLRNIDSSVDPTDGVAADNTGHFLSQGFRAKERDQQHGQRRDQVTPPDEALCFEQCGRRMERQLQNSLQLLNEKKHVQQKLMLIQQQQMQHNQQHTQQQQQMQHNQQHTQQQQQMQHNQQHTQQQQQMQHNQQHTQQQQQMQQHLQNQHQSPNRHYKLQQPRQQSPEQLPRDQDVNNRGGFQTFEQSPAGDSLATAQFSESFDGMTIHDLFLQCQNHLNVINACTDLQQTIKDEMKRQAKLDNIVSQKLMSKAQRLRQQAAVLEKAHTPAWVEPALHELGAHVNQQAEMHHVYTTTLIEQSVVIQHSLDGHHELMKSVLAQDHETKRNPTPPGDTRNKTTIKPPPKVEKNNENKAEEEFRSMTFLQASNIFEGIRKPRMKLLSSLEYQQEQLNGTLVHLGEVESEIEDLLKKEETENQMWRIHLQKKDLEIRKEFLEARKDQLESDVQFARMDLHDFEYSKKDSMFEVLNVFRQHRVRYDSTLRQSFQLLKAASLRDISFIRKLSKKNDRDVSTEHESDDTNDVNDCAKLDPWSSSKTTPSKLDASLKSRNTDVEEDSSLTKTLQNSRPPQIAKNKSTYLSQTNTQEHTEIKGPSLDQAYQFMLSSDSEISFLSKNEIQRNKTYKPDFKQTKTRAFRANPFQNITDLNFSRVRSFNSTAEINEVKSNQDEDTASSDNSEPPTWNVVKEKVQKSLKEDRRDKDDANSFIIAKHTDNRNFGKTNSHKSTNNSGLEDIMIVKRGPKSRDTLGNFESCVYSDSSIQSVYSVSSIPGISYNREDKRVAHMINKYASGSRSSRKSMGKNWNSCLPLVWYGIGNGVVKENPSFNKISKSIKRHKPFAQHNLLEESNEKYYLNSLGHLEDHQKGWNMNNSEALNGHITLQGVRECQALTECNVRFISQEPSSGQNMSEGLAGHAVNENSGGICEFFSVPNNDVGEPMTRQSEPNNDVGERMTRQSEPNNDVGEPLTRQNVDYIKSGVEGNRRQIQDGPDSLESQGVASKNVNSYDLLSAPESRNLNNCEPLKNHVVSAQRVLEGEDRLQFEVTQVLFRNANPRNIRVCTVRPIPLDVDSGGTGPTTNISEPTIGCKDFGLKVGAPYVYDHLKLYEATAGQFVVPDLETQSRHMSTTYGMRGDSSYNKQATCNASNQTNDNPNCYKKSICSSTSVHYNESVLRGKLKSKTKGQCGMPLSEALPLANVTVYQPTGVQCEPIHNAASLGMQEVNITHHPNMQSLESRNNYQHSFEKDDIYCTFSKQEHCPETVTQIKISTLKHAKSSGNANIIQGDGFSDNGPNEEETMPKTVYISDQQVSNSTESFKDKQSNVTETSDMSMNIEAHDGTSHTTQQRKALKSNPSNKCTLDVLKDGKSISNFSDTFYPVNSGYDASSYLNEGENLVQDMFEPDNTIIPRPCKNNERIITVNTFCQGALEKLHNVSEQSANQMNQTGEYDGEIDCDPSQQYHQTNCMKQRSDQSFQERTIFISNTTPQTWNRPLKSSLKKYIQTRLPDNDANNDMHGGCCQRVFQCGITSIPASNMQKQEENLAWQQGNSEATRQLGGASIQKCVKQVRFDHTVHYDDNTEINSMDIALSNEDVSDVSYNNTPEHNLLQM